MGDDHQDAATVARAKSHPWTITEVALTTAVAGAPCSSPSAFAASLVIPPPSGWPGAPRARPARNSSVDSDLAHDPTAGGCVGAEPVACFTNPRGHLDSATSRLFAESRVVRIRPARSHRRSVSMLIPSSCAASPAGIERMLDEPPQYAASVADARSGSIASGSAPPRPRATAQSLQHARVRSLARSESCRLCAKLRHGLHGRGV